MARGGGIRWLGWLAAAFAVAAGVLVLVTRLTADQLSTADEVASVIAAVVAVLGVPIAVVLARRGSTPSSPATGREVRQTVRAGGKATVAAGDLHIGPGRRRRGSSPGTGGRVQQDVQSGLDAVVAGGDLHLERGRDQW